MLSKPRKRTIRSINSSIINSPTAKSNNKRTRKKSPIIDNNKNDIIKLKTKYNTPIVWRPLFSTIRSKKNVINPTIENIPRMGIFLHFFKRLLMEPPVRNYFIKKYHPDFQYYIYRIDYYDNKKDKKVEEMKRILNTINEKYPTQKMIIDIAEQTEADGGGHWTSLKYEDEHVLYMDSDPFHYGMEAEEQHKSFHDFTRKFGLPRKIYDTWERKQSIQRLHTHDTFCQSWSLLYDTMIEKYPEIYKRIYFETKKSGTENLPRFIHNFRFLISFWKELFINDAGEPDMNFDLLIEKSQWKYWKSRDIIDYLRETENFIEKNMNKILSDKKTEEYLFFKLDENVEDDVIDIEEPFLVV
jgi:adenylate kinase family enzyme